MTPCIARPVAARAGLRFTIAALLAMALSAGAALAGNDDLAPIRAQLTAQHDANVQRLRDWIALPSIAAENLNYPSGAEHHAQLLRDAVFQQVEIIPTEGKPGVFATLDAGAEKTVGVYFMYDVKQYDASEWKSPPLEGRIVDMPDIGKVMMGRGAVNQKGPQSALLAALHAYKAAGRKLPVNLVLVAEGEEEIGSVHIRQLVQTPKVQAALAKTIGVFMPTAMQGLDGVVTVSLGAKGIVELELIASGEKWGRGPNKDVHSSLKAMVDSPAWRLVKALDTLVSEDGNTITIDDYPKAPPISDAHRAMIAKASTVRDEAITKQQLGVKHWIDDLPWQQAQERLVSQPTVNI